MSQGYSFPSQLPESSASLCASHNQFPLECDSSGWPTQTSDSPETFKNKQAKSMTIYIADRDMREIEWGLQGAAGDATCEESISLRYWGKCLKFYGNQRESLLWWISLPLFIPLGLTQLWLSTSRTSYWAIPLLLPQKWINLSCHFCLSVNKGDPTPWKKPKPRFRTSQNCFHLSHCLMDIHSFQNQPAHWY